MDEEARNICKPYGCKVTKCLSKYGTHDCGGLMAALTNCL